MIIVDRALQAREAAGRPIVTYDDVELPLGRLADKLRAEQEAPFG